MSTRSEADRATVETTSQPLQEDVEGSEVGSDDVATPDSEAETEKKRTFGSLTPQEAGRKGGLRRQEQARASAAEAVKQSSGKVVIVRCPVAVGDILSRLQIDAKKGNTQAARELREWMRQYPADDETDLSALDARTRQEVLSRVLADIVEDEGALPEGPLDQ